MLARLKSKRFAALALVLPVAGASGLAVAREHSRSAHGHLSKRRTTRGNSHAASKAPTRLRIGLNLPGFGLSFAPRVTLRGSLSRATISGRVDPGDGHVTWTRGRGVDDLRGRRVKVVRGRFRVSVGLVAGVNEFRFRGDARGLRSDAVTAVIKGPTARVSRSKAAPKPEAQAQQVTRRKRWLSGFEITEYFPVPERWFQGRRVEAPGLAGRHRIDWLYSARGLPMEGDGIGLDGDRYHYEGADVKGWVDLRGRPGGSAYWLRGAFWKTDTGRLTFPLEQGGWSAGAGARYVPAPGARFASGPSRPLKFYESVAVDPKVIPLGTRIYIPAYRAVNGGWFRAADVGGAIKGRHIDVYRPPPDDRAGRHLTDQRVRIVPAR